MSAPSFRLARAPLAAFAAMGICWGGFAADLPDLKAMLAVDEALLGQLFLATPAAAILAMMAAPALARHLGRHVLLWATLAMALAFVLPGFAPSWAVFPLAMACAGATTGALDVLMNARGAEAEARAGHPLMALFHAAYSFGYAGGALLVGFLRSQGHGPGVVMSVIALTAALLALGTFERDGRISGLEKPRPGQAVRLGLVPALGGLIVMIAFMTENAVEYWSALHIEQTLGGSPALGSAAPALLALTMGLSRLAGQGLTQRIAPLHLLLGGAALAAAGALMVAAAQSPALAYAGFIVLGVGGSVLSPMAFTLVGRAVPAELRARAVARTTLLGYFGYFIGPSAMGLIAGQFGLRAAFLFVVALLAISSALVPFLTRRS